MDKFKNKYRIPSARAQWWDYGWNGAYFVTICTRNREHFFGKIAYGKMQLSPTGIIADILWHEIPHHHPFVELGDFVVMPNHVHGILILDKPDGGIKQDIGAAPPIVETGHALSLRPPGQMPIVPPGQMPVVPPGQMPVVPPGQMPVVPPGQMPVVPPGQMPNATQPIGQNRFQNIGKTSLSSIIGSYKSAVTKHANRLELEHGWQTRFHDHIIRKDAEYQRISDYIINNPANWRDDTFFLS